MIGKENSTIVGVPFYDGEGLQVLEACLSNIDQCLSRLNVDAKIIVGVNGQRTSLNNLPLSYQINRSKYNAEVKFIKTPPGLVNAEKTIARYAIEEGCGRIFLTDADISRLPLALKNLWEKGDKSVVGSNYTTYPFEILAASGINLTSQEIAYVKIFEADKHPQSREFTHPHRPIKRLKGSLLLVNTGCIKGMFGCQSITSDSRMNELIPETEKQVIQDSAFMHYPRVDLSDHIQARLRHFRAAAAEGCLDSFSKKSVMYSHRTAEEIAAQILGKYPQATEVASNFLLQCALRHEVAEICRRIVSGKRQKKESRIAEVDFTKEVHTYKEAEIRIKAIISQIDIFKLNSEASNGKAITQEGTRTPINLEPLLAINEYHKIITNYLGLPETAKI